MTPRQQEDVAKLLAKYDETIAHMPDGLTPEQELVMEACGIRAIGMLRTYLREVQNREPDPRTGQRIAPVDVYKALRTALENGRLSKDYLSPLATRIARLSHLPAPADSFIERDRNEVFEDSWFGPKGGGEDDFSTDPVKWSLEKLLRERKNGMPAVLEEWERRTDLHSTVTPTQ